MGIMTVPESRIRLYTNPDSGILYPLLLIIFCAGVYFRLDQFLLQVLLDDEWHAVHQLLAKDTRRDVPDDRAR